MTPISWKRISEAITHYEKVGRYQYIEVPWIVRPENVSATLPPDGKALHTDGGTLVGSAEQSFIQLMVDGKLGPGRYVAVSPCFRGDTEDELHQSTFMKVELIHVLSDKFTRLIDKDFQARTMANEARVFMHEYIKYWDADVVQTNDGYDIMYYGVELGSYGYREHLNHAWIYGTGLAEPRFSIALSKSSDT